MTVDDRQDVPGLVGDAAAGGLAGDDAGEIDGVAVYDGLAHARAGFETLNAHLGLLEWRALSSASKRAPPLHNLQRGSSKSIEIAPRSPRRNRIVKNLVRSREWCGGPNRRRRCSPFGSGWRIQRIGPAFEI